jgi:hypothetical protein
MADRKPLTVEECEAHAKECRHMALRATSDEHRIMLDHMADTWERICGDLKRNQRQ